MRFPKGAVISYTLPKLKLALQFYKTPEDLRTTPLQANKDIVHFNRGNTLFPQIISSNNMIQLWLFCTISGGMMPRTTKRHMKNIAKG